jgi:hypothetical protein
MMDASRLPADRQDKFADKHFQLGLAGAFVNPARVAVYRFVETEDKSQVSVMDAMDAEHRNVVASTFGASGTQVANLASDIANAMDGD